MSSVRGPRVRALVASAWLAACPEPSARERFATEVAPVLARRCGTSACHGVEGSNVGPSARRGLRFAQDRDARIPASALDDALASARQYINTTEGAALSSLLRKPSPSALGGLPHGGGVALHDREDPAYTAILRWIQRESNGGEDGDPSALAEGERFFAREVQPRLAAGQCMAGACHGEASGVPLRFAPAVDGVFSVAATRANYREALAHLSLGGWPELSRLARKPLRLSAGGLPHRGGNGIAAFAADPSGPLPRAIVAWASLERRLRAGGAPSGLRALAFVGGPVGPARVVEHGGFTPGSDVFLLSPATAAGVVSNLTARAHASPADVRDPAVDDPGERLAFTMRERADGPRSLYELDLNTGAVRPRTTPARLPDGRWSSDRWPAYGPDGRLWFVSDRAGTLAEHADGYDTDLYVIEPDGALTRRSFTPSPELATTFFRQGRETLGTVAFTAIRRLGDGYKGVVYRFPNDLHAEYHQHVGITLADDLTFHMRETPDGNYLGLLLDRDAVWSAGALVHVDRNLGIALPQSVARDHSLAGYRSPVSFLGPYGGPDDALVDPYVPEHIQPPARRSVSEGAWRDPHPLPDGRIVAAWADGTVRLRDPTRAPDFGLFAVTLERDGASGALRVAARERLVDLPGVSETQPVPVGRAVSAARTEPAPTGARGALLYGGAPMIESILRQVGPYGARAPRSDLRAVRVLQWIPRASDALRSDAGALIAPARASGAGPHLPARVLGEIPLEPDGTLYASLPAGSAFRLQFLDARGMAVGAQHNRWFDIHGGQTLRQGVFPSVYDGRCAVCHGSRSGRASSAFQPVDVSARASRSLARFEHDDPDRPREPVPLDGALPSEWRAHVAPALARSCAVAGCHDGAARAAGLALTPTRTARYDEAYETLLARGEGSRNGARYVDAVGTSARGSYLVERILGEELDAPRSVPATGPHRGQPPLRDDELAALVRWIESGAAWTTEPTP